MRRLLLTLVAAAACAAPAEAATVAVEGPTLVVRGGPGEANALHVRADPGWLAVGDALPPTPGAGCATDTLAASGVRCAAAGVSSLLVLAGDGDDTVLVEAALPSTILGGAGGDALSFAPAPGLLQPAAILDGDEGDD